MKTDELPEGWSSEVIDLINSLLQRKQVNRIGASGIAEIKSHAWFSSINWTKLANQEVKSPFIPSLEENFDSKHKFDNDPWKDENSELIKQNSALLMQESV